MVRKQAAWMRALDERILEHLHEAGESNPVLMEDNPQFDEMGVSRGQIRERCIQLADAGLIATTGKNWFDVTTWGQQYLDGEIDARHQPRPRPGRVL
ncbi:hypothetical protein [Halobacterium jilantaiense]|uniref:Phage PhiH1 repressor protein n=1 Tax=Halobacterium jilantaiense TaxID=355548 RepID=A0A1I0P8C3_9EURY|nr:hypothetical protein [Halobacterium jilantaiense]SEW10474.1 hypothetical protein SAMN04487945_1475 [Halobacterium jilantaiense]